MIPDTTTQEQAFITLKCGRRALVDGDDLPRLLDRVWYAQWRYKNGEKDYITAIRHVVSGKQESLHRVIMNAPEGAVVDHINGDVLDNRKQNLRICTNSENLRNRKKGRQNKSGYKGVYKRKHVKKCWIAEIIVAGSRHRLGSYYTPQEAAEAYKVACLKHHGEFARVS